jgi:hypothetical protein
MERKFLPLKFNSSKKSEGARERKRSAKSENLEKLGRK